MIKSEIKLNKKEYPILTQKITIICDECKKEFNLNLFRQIKGNKKYNKDLCRGCKQRDQIKNGIRGIQYINAGISAINNMKGKTHIEMYGLEKASILKEKNSIANSGCNNKNYGGKWHGIPPATLYKGKTYDEIYGKTKSDIIKKKLSMRFSGKNNPMYGKPSPNGSGNGWCGWYKKWFFRSLNELSFIIFYIERFNFNCESGEQKKYRMKYIDYDGNNRNYFSDFILNNKYMIEIKPKYLFNTIINKKKREIAVLFCKKNNLKYVMISPIKRLSFQEIKKMVDNNEIIFIDRYKEKYENWKNKIISI